MKKNTIILFIATIMISCTNSATNISENTNEDTEVFHSDSNNLITNINSRIDSSKLKKAFMNIYFGTFEKESPYKPGIEYNISKDKFTFESPRYDRDLGLYYFELHGNKQKSKYEAMIIINQTAEVISLKYGKPNTLTQVKKTPKIFLEYGISEILLSQHLKHPIVYPDDNGTEFYKFEWINDSIELRLSYSINYEPIFKEGEYSPITNNGKVYTNENIQLDPKIKPILTFNYIPIYEEANKKNHQDLKIRTDSQQKEILIESSKF